MTTWDAQPDSPSKTKPNLDLADNLILKSYRRPPIGKGWLIDLSQIKERAEKLINAFNVMTPGTTRTSRRQRSSGQLVKFAVVPAAAWRSSTVRIEASQAFAQARWTCIRCSTLGASPASTVCQTLSTASSA